MNVNPIPTSPHPPPPGNCGNKPTSPPFLEMPSDNQLTTTAEPIKILAVTDTNNTYTPQIIVTPYPANSATCPIPLPATSITMLL